MEKVKLTDELVRYDVLLGESTALYHDIALKLGLTDSAMDVLYALTIAGGSSPLQMVIRYSGLSKQTVNSAVRRLEKDGMIYLTAEGRAKTVWLTEDGQRLAERTVVRLMKLEQQVLAKWSPEDVDLILGFMERWVRDLREAARDL